MLHPVGHLVRRSRDLPAALAVCGRGWTLGGMLACVLAGLVTGSALASSNGSIDPYALIQRMEHSYDGIHDYTALFFKRERINDRLLPLERIELRFQEPFKVYMAWKKPHEGREITYIEGENNDKMLVKPGGLLGFMRLSLDPSSAMATRNSQHTVRQVGLENTIKLLMAQYRRGMNEGVLTLRFLGHDRVGERPAYRLEFICDVGESTGYYAHRGEIWLDKKRYLPIKLRAYDWSNELYAYYEYRQLQLNPGLGPMAFKLDQARIPGMPSTVEAAISDQ
jgi:outer membrane lipoprotein-sorting protein